MYPAVAYNQVFEAMRSRFGETWYQNILPWQWVAWRRRIKERFFDQDILVREMVAGLDEAAGKDKWPRGVSFFERLENVVWKNRRESRWRSPAQVDRGMERIGGLLPRP